MIQGCNQSAGQDDQQLPKIVDFNYHIKPILSDRCYTCHGPDENARKAGFRLDLEEDAFAPLDSLGNDYAIVPGSIKKSHLIKRIVSSDADYMMPPPESNLNITEYEIALIERWIDQGAEWKPHWSFIKPEKPDIPDVKKRDWATNEIDYFVLGKMESSGLKPSDQETKEKLLRRLSFDLTGLPPTTDELIQFLDDESPDAFEKQIDRLLASPAYGERMAAIWLEAARYADSHGYQDDRPRTIWPWRDWVIKAFNENLPYKDFIIWQLAGDLLPDASYEQKLATAFNRNHAITQEGGVINEEYVTEYVADRTNTTSAAFMGLTMECARCHDHKYDPISQKEYYQMFAFFNGIDERGQINYFDLAPVPNMKMEDEELTATIKMLDSIRAYKETEYKELESTFEIDYQKWRSGFVPDEIASWLDIGLLAHFKLDDFDNLMTTNSVPDGFNGQANVKIISELVAPETVPGWDNVALKFDGKNYLSLGDVGDFEESDRFSVGGFIHPTSNPDKKAGLFVRRNGEQRRGGYELVLDPDGRLSGALVHNHNNDKIQVVTRSRIPLNRWSHVFMTYDGSGRASGISIYVNGVPQSTITQHDQLNRKSILNGNDFLVGNWTPRRANSKEYYGFQSGAIDEVRIYNRNLSDAEVRLLANTNPTFSNNEIRDFYRHNIHSASRSLQSELDSIRGIYMDVPYVMIMQEMDTPRVTHILDRGVYDAPLEKVEANTPSNILEFSDDLPKNRLGLALWLTDPENPLTARVAVNRFWQMMFGRGLVNTPEDFGNQGDLPSHPELLDWLAVRFLENDWDVKALLKTIAMSSTYRQSAEITDKKLSTDPDNVLLSRGPYNRLEAEMLRDQALVASGLLNPKVGGKWVKPYQPKGIWKELANQIGENKYRAGEGADLYRRSLYSYWKRTIPPPFMLTFDASERAVCVLKRQSTSTPLQALGLLNDPQFIEASRVLAQRTMIAKSEPSQQIDHLFFALTSRKPTSTELDNLLTLFQSEKSVYEQDQDATKMLLEIGEAPVDENLPASDLAALTVVTNIILNLDEAKMKS